MGARYKGNQWLADISYCTVHPPNHPQTFTEQAIVQAWGSSELVEYRQVNDQGEVFVPTP